MPETADEARQGLLTSITGTVKEVAGALPGNDSLTTEGQLQQAETAARKDAAVRQAVAEEQAQDAVAEIAESTAKAGLALKPFHLSTLAGVGSRSGWGRLRCHIRRPSLTLAPTPV